MNWTAFLFSFRGRINRAKYWLAALVYGLVTIVFFVLAFVALGNNIDNLFSFAGIGILLWIAGLFLFLAVTWSSIVVGIKRLHDREKSGWWMLVFLLGPTVLNGMGQSTTGAASLILSIGALAVSVWAFVELGCLRGTPGSNLYGPDPLGFSREPLR
jgi:uncharacterized membrane protein YhaH (DUF805 family)